MNGLLETAILVALLTWFAFADKYLTQFFTYRPIVIGPLVGILMGDLRTGLEVGVVIELMFLGTVFLGTALPPEETFSTIIATAFAIIAGGSVAVAVAFALPIGIMGRVFMQIRNSVLTVRTQSKLEEAVEKLSIGGILRNTLLWPNVFNGFLFALPVFLAIYFGADVIRTIVPAVPPVVMDGLEVAGKMIGAVGLAQLLQTITSRKLWPFSLVGFFATSYLKVNVIGVTLIAVICVTIYHYATTGAYSHRPPVGQ